MNELGALVQQLREGRGFVHKRDIGDALTTLSKALPEGLTQAALIGDDCAAIPDGDGFLLFAIEGFVDDFVSGMPWFAGWSGVMVNLSDIAAMGGRPIAVVDALWAQDGAAGAPVLQGMAAASAAYGVPIVGGHTNHRSARCGLAVAVLGRAKKLLTSFDARPGDHLVMAVDLRGAYEEPHPFWNAATKAPPERLRGDLALLPQLAERELCIAAKDISMAGPVGTALMLLESSRVGARITLDALPRPPGVPLARWLQTFPSFGYVLSVAPPQVDAVCSAFAARDIAVAVIGEVTAAPEVWLQQGAVHEQLWNVAAERFIAPAHA